MDTSGVLLFAKTEEVYREMQRMFALHEDVEKEYVAKLSLGDDGRGMRGDGRGVISIPLAPDFLNRPRQRVDYENGKEAVTRYVMEGDTVHLFPLTGRTHQLRIHCAHPDGLGCPIVGDELYGTKGERLMLHAAEIWFRHPITKEAMHLVSPPPFLP
jgi:tRNA pseudouridine32 synthase/23S rRNA pseudouridine746 synthase